MTTLALLSTLLLFLPTDLAKPTPPTAIPPFDAATAAAALGRSPSSLRGSGSLLDPRLPAGTDTMPEIEHIVLVMYENHSYNSISNPYFNGSVQHSFEMPNTCQSGHVSQEWNVSQVASNNGSMDGFVRVIISPESMGYFTERIF